MQVLAELLRKSRPDCTVPEFDVDTKLKHLKEHLAKLKNSPKDSKKRQRTQRRTNLY